MNVLHRTLLTPTLRRLAVGLLALLLGAGSALLAGCGGGSENAGQTLSVPSTSTATTATTATATTTQPVTTQTVPTTAPAPTTSTAGNDGGQTTTTPANDGGVSPGEDTTRTVPTETKPATTPDAPAQDPGCKAGTGPGFPDKPQCEPVAGPDSRNEG
ncbi:MAG: hypothetical protein JWM31_64 [Solirubrobacterales bacterium]|nr:hypothetical protein [Solirubrobacterales bacterium]